MTGRFRVAIACGLLLGFGLGAFLTPSLEAQQPFNVAQINGITPLMGIGASGTGALRTAALIHDGNDTALVTATAGGALQVECVGGTCSSTGSTPYDHGEAVTLATANGLAAGGRVSAAAPSTTGVIDDDFALFWVRNTGEQVIGGSGAAGTAATGVLTVQGIASMTPILATVSDGAGALNVIIDSSATLTVASHAVTNAGTFAVQAAQSGTWDEVGINDSGNSITVDGTVITTSDDQQSDDDNIAYALTSPVVNALLYCDNASNWERCSVSTDWTIGTAITTTGPGGLGVYANFDGSAIPTIANVDTEGEAVPISASIQGVQYVMLVSEDGSLQYGTATTPLVVGDGTGALNVIIDSSASLTVTDGAGALNVIVDSITAGNNNIGDVDLASIAAGDTDIGNVDLEIAGTAIAVNTGTVSAQTLRMVIASDDPVNDALVKLDASLVVEDLGETASANLIGVGSVRRDVAASSAGTTGDNATVNTDALGLAWTRFLDPCSGVAKTVVPLDIVTATTVELANAVASQFFYICSIDLHTNAANNVVIAEDDTDGCGSISAGVTGGTTAAEGYTFAANGGRTIGNGLGTIAKTTTAARYLCILTSAATQLSGSITFASAP